MSKRDESIQYHDSPVWQFSFNEETGEQTLLVPRRPEYHYHIFFVLLRVVSGWLTFINNCLTEIEECATGKLKDLDVESDEPEETTH